MNDLMNDLMNNSMQAPVSDPMCDRQETLPVRMDSYTRLCLTGIVVLLAVLVIGLWAQHDPLAQRAWAKKASFAETGSQTQLTELIKAQNKTTAQLGAIASLLKSGSVKVQLVREPAKVKVKGGAHAKLPKK
ncbi:MAG: hypothetical protein J7M14_05230 [Planctomycetes bacterium]|nr:hypothetical protein [Planctomycetota bacterium]